MSEPTIDGPRACTRAEVPEVIALVDAHLHRQGTGQSILTDFPLVYTDENLANVRILKVVGELAAVVPFLVWPVDFEGCRFRMGFISPTATAVAHRRKGYGSRCLDDCIRRMEALGCELSVIRAAVATFPFYQGGEYEGVRSQGWVYPCGRDDARHFTPRGETIVLPDRLSGSQWAAIRAQHEADGGGTYRVPERYPALGSLPKMRTLLAYRGPEPVAYLVANDGLKTPGILEAGGDEAGVETLVHRALSDLDPNAERRAYVNLAESVLGDLLEKRLPGRRQPAAEVRMYRVNQPAAFFRGIAPWLERANAGADREFSVTTAGETIGFRFTKRGLTLSADRRDVHFDLTRRQLVSALFGPHPSQPSEPDGLAGLPRFHFPIWQLDCS